MGKGFCGQKKGRITLVFLTILQAANDFGIGHLLAVENPDSQLPHRSIDQFESVSDYRTLLDEIVRHPVR